jgi:hypothetical protein
MENYHNQGFFFLPNLWGGKSGNRFLKTPNLIEITLEN